MSPSPSRFRYVAFLLGLFLALTPFSVLARTNRDIICNSRPTCTGSGAACPSGTTCRPGSAASVAAACSTANPSLTSSVLCLSDSETTCANDPACLDRDENFIGPIDQPSDSESGNVRVPDMDAVSIGAAATGTITPVLSIQIPGLTFGDTIITGDSIVSPHVAQYISAVYRYAVSIVAIVATIMVVYGGFRYLIGSTSGEVKKGKEIIMDAVAGMVLLLSAYAILATINPAVLTLTGIRTRNITNVPLETFGNNLAWQNAGSPSPQGAQVVNQNDQPIQPAPPSPQPSQSGDVTTFTFNYQPNRNEYWASNQAQIMIPTRLLNQSAPIHLYVYIHGNNNGHQPSSSARYTSLIRGALQRVSGSKNIVIAAPHFLAGEGVAFMPGFSMSSFMTAVQAAMRSHPELQRLSIRDVVASGHSRATCSPVLTGAARNPAPNQIAVVAYDGCEGYQSSHPRSFSAPLLLMNMDDMGHAVQSTGRPAWIDAIGYWHLTQMECPSYIIPPSTEQTSTPGQRRSRPSTAVRGCYKNQANNVFMYVSGYGHGPSVGKMTDWAFQQLYPQNDR